MVVEDRVRGSEETALAACRATAAETLAAADERFAVMAAYLRPGLLTVPEAARASLLVVMSDTAADYAPRVEAALETCAAVRPVWFHRDLAARRDAYVDHLSATAELLRSIQGDGGRYYRDTPELDAERLRLFGA